MISLKIADIGYYISDFEIEDYDEEEDDDDDDDSMYEFEKGKSSLHRKREAMKRNASGYPVGSSQILETALGRVKSVRKNYFSDL